MIDIFGRRKKFLKSLKQGQIIRHRGLFTNISNIYELMEFGHYDEQEDRVYFQRAKVVAGNYSESDGVVQIAKVSKSGDPYIFKQIADDNKGGSYSLASVDEIERFEDAYDKQLLKFYLADDGSMDGIGCYIRERTDGRLTRLALASDPPRYLFIKTERGEYVIMEFGRIAPVGNKDYGLFAKGMYLLDDKIQELEGYNYVCIYETATEIREASDAERKMLVIMARDVQKKREATKNIDDDDEEASGRNKRQAEFDGSLRPFVSKVLVSNGDSDVWRPAIFGCVPELGERYMTVGGQQWKYCIPLKGHRELLGKVFERRHLE